MHIIAKQGAIFKHLTYFIGYDSIKVGSIFSTKKETQMKNLSASRIEEIVEKTAEKFDVLVDFTQVPITYTFNKDVDVEKVVHFVLSEARRLR